MYITVVVGYASLLCSLYDEFSKSGRNRPQGTVLLITITGAAKRGRRAIAFDFDLYRV